MYIKYIKPTLDFLIAFTTLVILAPLLLIIILLLFIFNRQQVFFIQERPGKNEKIFKIIKFKTMNDAKDITGNLLPDNKRLTPLGKVIRKLSIDELPQLLNVIKGDMSLVGPRPLLVEYLSSYNDNQKRRHLVKPGITGWAQVNGRNLLTWEEKFNHDLWYADNISFTLDLKIILMTILKILKREGISSTNSETMEKFTGNL